MTRAAFLEHWTGRIDLHAGETVVGRDPRCDVHLEDEALSRRHLLFVVDDVAVTVEDLGSTNGTTLNSKRLRGPRPIHDGDVLQIGSAVYIFRLEEQPGRREPPLSDLARAFVSQSDDERRCHRRIPTSIPVRIVADDRGEHSGVAWDISEGGMFIACSSVEGWAPGTRRFRVTFTPEDGVTLAASGVVRHVIRSATTQGHPPGLGIRFDGLDETTRRWLAVTVSASR